MYEGIVGNQFMFLHCWFMLRNEVKWNNWLDSMSSPNNAEEVRPGEPTKDSTLPAKIARAMGRDRAKKQQSSNNSSNSNSTVCLEVL
jgi:hypothetical protein